MSWDVFISHASEDKAAVAKPLAEMLQAKGIKVWYDEFTLNIGDRLRQSIDHGLANSRYGLVVLSPKFFEKKWPQNELDGLISMETPERPRILPVWHQVSADEVKGFSPMLAGRVGISTASGLEHLVAKIISKVFVYRVNDHYGRTYDMNLSECEASGTPIFPAWFRSDPKRISSTWLEKKLKEKAELRIFYKQGWCDGTWFVVDVPNEVGEVINLDQLRDLMPSTATTTTTSTTTTTPSPILPKRTDDQ
jgi:hypothetical protein